MSRGKRARKQTVIRRAVKRAQKFKRYAAEVRAALEAHTPSRPVTPDPQEKP
jgi:hypothetical protein